MSNSGRIRSPFAFGRADARVAPEQSAAEPGAVKYKPQLPTPPAPTTGALAPVASNVKATPTVSPVPAISVWPAALLGNIADAHVRTSAIAPNGLGSSFVSGDKGGLRINGDAHVHNGTLTNLNIDFTKPNGQRAALHTLLFIGIHGAHLDSDRKVRVDTDLGAIDVTGKIVPGAHTIPVDPMQLVRAFGVDNPINLTSPNTGHLPAKANAMGNTIDPRTAVVDATVELATSPPNQMTSFGDGLRMSFASGSKVRVQRSPGHNIYTINAAINEAQLGQPGGAQVHLGPGKVNLVAEETLVDGKSHWSVRVLDANQVADASLDVPVKGQRAGDHLELGSISALSNNGAPIITVENGRLDLGFNTTVSRVNGTMQLTDAKGRQGSLIVGNPLGGAPMSIGARIDVSTDVNNPTQVANLKAQIDTKSLNVAVKADDGIGVLDGDGLSLGVRTGTSITGDGRLTFERTASSTSNFTIDSQNGYHARVRVDKAEIKRRLGDIGVSAEMDGASYIDANVRKYDWRSGTMRLGVDMKAHLTTASLSMPDLHGQVQNTGGRLQAEIAYKPGSASPTIKGDLTLEIEGKPGQSVSQQPAVEFALPTKVQGYNRPGEGSIRTQLVDGKLQMHVPFTIDERGGLITKNRQSEGATLDFHNVVIGSHFANSALPATMPVTELDAARVRHAAFAAGAPQQPIPPIEPLSTGPDVPIIDQVNNVTTQLDVPSLVGGLKDISIDSTTTLTREHNVHVLDWHFGSGSIDVTAAKGTKMRLVINSTNGEIGNLGLTRPDGSPNPSAGQPSGIEFDPPLMLRRDGSQNPNAPQGIWEDRWPLKRIDITPDPKDPSKLIYTPHIGSGQGNRAWLYDSVAKAFPGGMGGVAAWAMRAYDPIGPLPRNAAELAKYITRATNMYIDVKDNMVDRIVKATPESERALVRDAMAHTTVLARGTMSEDRRFPIGRTGDYLTLNQGQPLVISNVNGQVNVTGAADLGPSRLTTPSAGIAFNHARASIKLTERLMGPTAGETAIELTDLQATGLNLHSNQATTRVSLTGIGVTGGYLTIRAGANTTTVQGTLNGLTIGGAQFTGRDGSTYGVAQGSARSIVLEPSGAVDVSGLTGTFSANAWHQGSQVYMRTATLTGGKLHMTPKGEISTSPLRLSNARGSITNFRVPRGSQGPAGISASVKRMDMDFSHATLSLNPTDGLVLTTPKNEPGHIRLIGSATFENPTPKIHVRVVSATSDGYLRSLQINRRTNTEKVQMSDWYIQGYATGTVVAGEPGSAMERLAIGQGANIGMFVKSFGATAGKTTNIDASVVARITGEYSLPPSINLSSSVRADLSAKGTIDMAVNRSGHLVRADAIFHLTKGHGRVDAVIDPKTLRADVQSSVNALEKKLEMGAPAPAPAPIPNPAPRSRPQPPSRLQQSRTPNETST